MPPHVLSDFVVSPPRLWLKCNRLLRLGRPAGAVTLSRWGWWWNERWIWGARGALNLISTSYPDHGHHGRLPLSRKNAHGRAGNRTRDLMVGSQELWPPSHEAGHLQNIVYMKYFRDCDPAAIMYYILASFWIYRTNIGYFLMMYVPSVTYNSILKTKLTCTDHLVRMYWNRKRIKEDKHRPQILLVDAYLNNNSQ